MSVCNKKAYFLYSRDFDDLYITRSLGALRAPTSSVRPFGPAFGPSGLLDFVLRALRALRPCDPHNVALDGGKLKKFLQEIWKKMSRNPKNVVYKSKKFRRQIQKILSTNPKNFVNKSKKFRQQIQKILSINPTNFVNKSKKFRQLIQKI